MRGPGSLTALGAAAAVLLSTSPAAASGWTIVPSPPSDGGFFNAVSARTDTDAWAVGDLSATTPLTARWNGTSWSQVPGPTVTGATNTVLNAVSAASAADAWAVGRATQSLVTSSLAAHWNGTAWTVVPTPQIAGSVLTSVVDISPADAYAIGSPAEALHWNGTAWSVFAVPAPGGATPALLSAVAARSASDVWIAGQYFDTAKNASEPFIAHFNGTAWSPGHVPANGAEFFGLTAFSALIAAFTANIIKPIVARAQGSHSVGLGVQLGQKGNTATFLNFGGLISAIIYFIVFMLVVYFVIIVPYRHIQSRRGQTVFGDPAPVKTCPYCLSSDLPVKASKCKYCGSEQPEDTQEPAAA